MNTMNQIKTTSLSRPNRKNSRRGFTLIELLVVIAIIMLLLSILMPVLGRIRQLAKMTTCMGNHKALVSAWQAYSGDNRQVLIRADAGAEGFWIKGWSNNPDNITNAEFYRYTGTMKVYLCPEEKRDRCIRSYSIADPLNGHRRSGTSGSYTEHDASGNSFYNQWRGSAPAIVKTNGYAFTQGQVGNPSKSICFSDEFDPRADSWGQRNLGTLVTSDTRWIDYPPPSHIEGCVFSFADGHTENYRYVGEETSEINKFYYTPSTPEGYQDMRWVADRYRGR